VKLISLPSKRLGLYTTAASTIIARSDSNGEDLEAFAGAGMSHSVVACDFDFLMCTLNLVHPCCALVMFSQVLKVIIVYAHVILAERPHRVVSNLVHIFAGVELNAAQCLSVIKYRMLVVLSVCLPGCCRIVR